MLYWVPVLSRPFSVFFSSRRCFMWSRSGRVQAGNGSCSLLRKARPPRLTRMKPRIFLLSAALLASGCTVGPNYQRPTAAVPGSYRGTTSDEAAQAQLAALGDQKWWDIFQDEQLRTLIRTALTQNYDSRIAASRVLEAQAQLGITRADQFPTLGAGAGIADVRQAKSKFLPAFETSTGQADLSAAWELDFWGKYRRATEAARANLLASEWARRGGLSTLLARVARAHFQLRGLRLVLGSSKATL